MESAKSAAEVLQVYGKLDLLNVGQETLASWQQDCGRRAAETNNGEVVSVTLFRMANETKNTMQMTEKLVGPHSAISSIATAMNRQ